MYKLSNFNLVSENKDDVIIFNTLARKTYKMNKEIYNNIDRISLDAKRNLLENHILTEKMTTFEEVIEFKKMRQQQAKSRMNIIYTVTTKCNLSCDYCFENHIERRNIDSITNTRFLALFEKNL